jgi:hypothetical protein
MVKCTSVVQGVIDAGVGMVWRWRRERGKWINIWVRLDVTDGAVGSYGR